MNSKKKIISFLLSFVMIISMAPMMDISVLAADENITDYLTYEINDGEVIITDCDESVIGDVVIPDTIEGYPVTAIGELAFANCFKLEGIKFPESLTEIGDSSFSMCISLEEISLPESLETIGSNAFGDCYSIEKIVLPDSIRSIGDYAFAFCINIESINIPSGLSVMNEGILSGCYTLKSISIPANVKSIKEGAIEACLSLEDIYIYNPIADINDRAIDTEGIRFSDITAAEYADMFAELNKMYVSDDYSEEEIAEKEQECEDASDEAEDCVLDVVIHGYNNSSASFYAQQNEIAFNAFEGSPDSSLCLSYEIIDGEVTITDCYDQFSGDMVIPETIEGCPVTAIADEAFAEVYLLESILIPETVTSIGAGAFASCFCLKNINIPSGVTEIKDYTFSSCYSLEEITLPDTITTIGEGAFVEYVLLKRINIPVQIKTIGYDAFSGCMLIEKIDLPESIEFLGEYAFGSAFLVTDLYFYNPDTVIGDDLIPEESIIAPSMTTKEFAEMYAKILAESTLLYIKGATEEEQNAFFEKYEDFFEIEPEDTTSVIVIHGYEGSTAQTYAEKNGLFFVPFEDCNHLNTEFRGTAEPTCVEEGFTGDLYCSDCGEKLADGKTVPIVPFHTFGEWKEVTAATCTQKGTNIRECVFCKTATEEEPTDAKGHTVAVIDGVPPTCTETGLTEGKHCEECGEVFVSQETVIALGHDYKAVVTAPDCENGGYTTYTCTACGDTYVANEVAPDGHNKGEVVVENEVAPKCDVAGSYDLVVYCDVCGEKLDRETVEVDALTHIDENGDYICDNGCGYEYEKPEEPTPDEPTPDTPEEPTDIACDHMCHQSGFMGFIWKIVQFFWYLFEMNPICKCGVTHY